MLMSMSGPSPVAEPVLRLTVMLAIAKTVAYRVRPVAAVDGVGSEVALEQVTIGR
jgi:hypothetical protein